MTIVPFFINSNICSSSDDISSFDKFMSAVAGNTGNSYITYALIKEVFGKFKKVDHIQNIYTYDFNKQETDIDLINNKCTHVFLILQDQIRLFESYGLLLPYEKIINFISKINKPIIIAGLGSNSINGYDAKLHTKLDAKLVDFLKFLSDRCVKIGVRGHYTEELLHNIGIDNVSVIGCPSFYEAGKNRILVKKKIIEPDKILLSSPVSIDGLQNNYQIVQDFCEEKYMQACAFGNTALSFTIPELSKIMQRKYRVFSNIESWKKFVSNFDITIGGRVHGSILSMNAGVIPICCNYDSRSEEMCSFLKIPHNPKIEKIKNVEVVKNFYDSVNVDDINKAYIGLYKNFQNFFEINNIQLVEPVFNLSGDNNVCSDNGTGIPDIELYANNIEDKLFKTTVLNEISKLNNIVLKPKLSEQLFSVKDEKNHKIVKFLGIKLKFRNNKVSPPKCSGGGA